MASFVKTISFFILLVLFTSLQIEASDRLFFSKVSGSNNNYNAKDPKIPLSYQQEAKPSPDVAALTTQAQKVAVDPPKKPIFSRNEYESLFGPTDDTSAAIGTSSNSDNGKQNNKNGDNFIYNTESDFNGNGNGDDNIGDEIKQQGLSDTRFLEHGRYINVDKNRFNDTARRGSAGNEGFDGKIGKQSEFDSLEEYEKYLQRNGYLP